MWITLDWSFATEKWKSPTSAVTWCGGLLIEGTVAVMVASGGAETKAVEDSGEKHGSNSTPGETESLLQFVSYPRYNFKKPRCRHT